MTTIPNDDFDMCCGSRPHVETVDWGTQATCGICGDRLAVSTATPRFVLMMMWNKRQREKVENETPPHAAGEGKQLPKHKENPRGKDEGITAAPTPSTPPPVPPNKSSTP